MEISPDLLPPRAKELADVIGLDGLLRLVGQYGGLSRKVPVAARPDHDFATCLNPEQYAALVETYRGERIDIPRLHRAYRQLIWHDVMQRRARGETVPSIARRHRLTERAIYLIQARMAAKADNQGELF